MSEYRSWLSDAVWEKIQAFLRSCREYRGAKARNNRHFFESVLWILRTGSPWRDLPVALGKWSTHYARFLRWAKQGKWQSLQEFLANSEKDPVSHETLFIDSTIIRAHQHAAGGCGGQDAHALGRSRGGLGTKIHVSVDKNWHVFRAAFTGGHAADTTQAESLIAPCSHIQHVVLDKGYDAQSFVNFIAAQGGTAVIPPRKNRCELRAYDAMLYRERNVVERFFARIKQFRRIATRFDKTLKSFAAMFALAVAFVCASHPWQYQNVVVI